jgi:dipeptidase E
MKLAFYSDQIIPENRRVDAVLVSMLPSKARVGFVPSEGDPKRKSRIDAPTMPGWGFSSAHSHDPATGDRGSLAESLSCDAIHLCGGNTEMRKEFEFRQGRSVCLPDGHTWLKAVSCQPG